MLSPRREAETSLRRSLSLTLLGLACVTIAGCGTTSPDQRVATPLPTLSAVQATGVSYQLLTHCGIDEAQVAGKYYEAVTPLNDGNGNPPAGWDNPFQVGVMTVTSAQTAVFTDDRGHRVVFRVRAGASNWKMVGCS